MNISILLVVLHCCRLAITWLNINLKLLGLYCFVFIAAGIIIGEFYCWHLKLTLITWHHKIVVYHVSLNSIGCELCLVTNLWVILVKVLWEIYNRLLNKFQVSHTTNNHSKLQRFASLNGSLVQLSRDMELTHTT